MSPVPTFPRDYRLHGGIFFPQEPTGDDFTYSDGDAFEAEIATIIRKAEDKSLFSRELMSAIWDWRSRCHLSPARANLLRPLAEALNGHILELGSGCGPLTRYLGELGGDVVALEASAFRASVTRERTLDLPNVRVVCERIENFVSETKFDVVTLVGVLQYARLFTDLGIGAEKILLENAARQLDDDGVLVLAIQNKLGLKYLAGWPEPNVGSPYFGIHELYGDKTAIRFGMVELQALLSSVGLAHQTFLFPFPDYHIPSLILSAEGLRAPEPFRAGELIAMAAAGDMARPDYELPAFSLERAHLACQANGLSADLANAFLVIAGKTPQCLTRLNNTDLLGWHYTAERPPEYAVDTRFVQRGGNIEVVRAPLVTARGENAETVQNIVHEAYLPGQLQWSAIVDVVNRRDWTVSDVAACCRPWLETLMAEAGLKASAQGYPWTAILSGRFYDATPSNLILSPEGRGVFFDQEWHLPEKLNFDFIAFRGVVGSLLMISSFARPSTTTPITVMQLGFKILTHLGLPEDEGWPRKQLEREFSIQRRLSLATAKYDAEQWISDMLGIELRIRRETFDREIHAERERTKQLQALLHHQEQQLEQQEAEILRLESSLGVQVERRIRAFGQRLYNSLPSRHRP